MVANVETSPAIKKINNKHATTMAAREAKKAFQKNLISRLI
jgi:hypothetical protein